MIPGPLPGMRAYWTLHSNHPSARAERLRIARVLALIRGRLPPEEMRRVALAAAIRYGHPEFLDVEGRREYDAFMRAVETMAPRPREDSFQDYLHGMRDAEPYSQ